MSARVILFVIEAIVAYSFFYVCKINSTARISCWVQTRVVKVACTPSYILRSASTAPRLFPTPPMLMLDTKIARQIHALCTNN